MSFNPVDCTDLAFRVAAPSMPDYGVTQEPIFGGPMFKINRLGAGFVAQVTLPPADFEPDGRRLIARLLLAKRQGVVIRYSQPGFDAGAPGAPTVDGAVAGGMTLPVTGAGASYFVREGQALNVVKSGRKYLYLAGSNVSLDSSGDGSIALATPLRTQLAGGESVVLRDPVIEGWIEGDNFGATIDEQRMVGLSFSVRERA